MINKLRALLMEVDEIRKDLMELKCMSNVTSWNGWLNSSTNIILEWGVFGTRETPVKEDVTSVSILSNPIEERHLRMYCEKKINELIMILSNWEMIQAKHFVWNASGENIRYSFDKLICKLDNTKSLNNQSEEVLKKIVEFLENNK